MARASSRLADEMEAVQLRMGTELLGHADALLGNPKAGAGELRFLANRLVEALRDALRVADSRGRRLPGRRRARGVSGAAHPVRVRHVLRLVLRLVAV
ncbi:hypothetical protein [Streptomyces sp. RTd22]|uniref:hypothetical protein n=1 Tax=Streptomyces sp. RTd22 TaxID=1841249 RepID=UPI001F25F97C|nr:hypothetical protein [Streptomyces sp. RTd22]